MIRILVLGGGAQGLSVSRSLCESGYEAVVISSNKDATAYSRYVSHFEALNSPLNEPDLVSFVCRVVKTYCCKVIIPMSDAYGEFLSKNKPAIERRSGAKCAVADYDKFEVAYNKNRLLSLCERYNIPHPPTTPLDANNLEEASRKVGFPALIKPDHSVGARGITLVRNQDELADKYRDVERKYGTSTLQAYIGHAGKPYYNVMLYRDSSGRILSSVILEIQRYYPIKGGSNSYGVTVHIPELISLCERLLSVLDWSGFVDFDVLKEEKRGYLIIEINPRVPASLRAAAVSGVNFPEMIVRGCLGMPQKEYHYSPGKALRYLGLDIMWFFASEKRWSCSPSWFRFMGKDLYYQEGGIKDFKAMCFSLWQGMKKAFSPNFKKSKSGMS